MAYKHHYPYTLYLLSRYSMPKTFDFAKSCRAVSIEARPKVKNLKQKHSV